ncbi:MAG: alpha/beta hydrolase family protein [Candidatus Binatia bacterium]
MKTKIFIYAMALFTVIALHFGQSFAQNFPTYHQLGPAKATLWRPASGTSNIAIVVMHRTSNFLNLAACREMSNRGFVVLCINTRFDNNESQVIFEQTALDVKAGVLFLRQNQSGLTPGITRVLLWGYSGGGPAMSFYQAVAESGVGFCQDPHKLVKCDSTGSTSLVGLPPADGIVFVDAHPGVATIGTLRSLDPSVTNENNPDKGVNKKLDPYDPKNGFNPNGVSTYSDKFKQAYFEGQSARLNRLIDEALDIQQAIAAGKYPYTDDAPFVIGRSTSAKLFTLDTSILHSTVRPQALLKNDGSIDNTHIVESVRLPVPTNAEANDTFDDGGKLLTVKSFLSTNAIFSTNSIDGIDYCSSNDSTPCNVQQITVPVLFNAMGAYYFIRDNEIHYDLVKSQDKEFIVIAGLVHGITPCNECPGGPYNNSQKNFYDYVASWINKPGRF